MPAELINERPSDEEDVEFQDLTAEPTPEPAPEPEPEEEEVEQPEPEEDIPEKYRGKSLKDLVQMHQESEKLLGRHSSEVGELRRAVDDLVKAQLESKTKAEPEEEVDFFSNPEEAVRRILNDHPQLKAAGEVSVEMKRAQAQAALKAAHPDMDAILQDDKFGEWVGASKIRTKLIQQAHNEYDFEAADELFTLWKERQGVAKATAEVEKKERKQAIKAAATGGVKGNAPKQPKKFYRRADILKLMREQPDRYASLAAEIRQAYAEGRVRN